MKALLLIPILGLAACATQPRVYQAPDQTRLKASTTRVSVAVDKSHQSARKAALAVNTARARAKEVEAETRKIKDVPVSLIEKVTELEARLDEATQAQTELEQHLVEADGAKAEVEKDKTDYFGNAQKLADQATDERNARIKAEQRLHWYRMHWWGAWIVAGIGILICIVLAIARFAGKFALIL